MDKGHPPPEPLHTLNIDGGLSGTLQIGAELGPKQKPPEPPGPSFWKQLRDEAIVQGVSEFLKWILSNLLYRPHAPANKSSHA